MTRKIQFVKMHGAGNDYIYIDTDKYPITNPRELAIKWSAPHTGIGSDGLVLIASSKTADFSMRIFNADGSEAMMCGNASRCIGKYLYEYGKTNKTDIALDTLSGIKILHLSLVDNKVDTVTVDMGIPNYELVDFNGIGKEKMVLQPIIVNKSTFIGTAVSMGNPHFVIFVDNVEDFPVDIIGPQIEHNTLFPDRINVEFAQVLDDNNIRMRVWERGSGITMACGTGACATEVAAFITHKATRKSNIIMDGGTLSIEWNEKTKHVYMTGPATIVFEGTIDLADNE
jgi:diaminopimelate epimerase